MDNVKELIINYLNEVQLGTEEVSDCMNKTGLISGAKSIKPGNYCAGEVQYIYGYDDSNWAIHEQIINLSPNKIVFVDDINVSNRALFGQLVSGFIIKKKKALGIVTTGFMRDIKGLLDEDFKVWCQGITPLGCFNKKMPLRDEVIQISEKHKQIYDGSIFICDNSGVVMIPKDMITETFYQKLKDMEKQEETWFDCVGNKNWSTYDTVCLKKYLNGDQL